MTVRIETSSTGTILKPFQKSAAISSFSLDSALIKFSEYDGECFRRNNTTILCRPLYSRCIEDIGPILRSNLLGTPIEFSLSTLCETLELPNVGDLVYLMVYDNLLPYGKIQSELYSVISVNGEKPCFSHRSQTQFLHHFHMVYQKCCPQGGHNDFVHNLQSLFLHSRH